MGLNNESISQFRKHLKFSYLNKLRLILIKNKLGKCGKSIWIDKNVEFLRFTKNLYLGNNLAIKEGTKICPCNDKAEIHIGNNTTIGYHNFIFASNNIKIGDNCLIAPFVYIVDSNHQIDKDRLINLQPNLTEQIIIGNDVWVASNTTILKGVTIGDGAVIAANSLVNKSIPRNEVWGGSPAKKIGERK
jgi:acetyltransferase-like isoleucine patch superfamily enzyme